MEILVFDDYQGLSRKAADLIKEQVTKDSQSVLGLATGSTPLGLYKEMINDYQHGLDFSQVTSFNLDEYVGLSGDHPASYRYFMEQHLFSQINIKPTNIHIPNGQAMDIERECRVYESAIQACGGIDLQILGIGHNGHIGFNEPGTPFGKETHLIELTESTRQANARFFSSIDEVPSKAISMGIKSIMKAKQILLLASGESKAGAVHQAVEGPVVKEMPASILQLHPNVVLLLDTAAASGLNRALVNQVG